MSAALSTHVLDLTTGRPAGGMTIDVFRDGRYLSTVVTNADGRTDTPLVAGAALAAGEYELVFHVRAYFASSHADATFLDRVPIRFTIVDPRARYHVPLLCTPWAYSTYRGS